MIRLADRPFDPAAAVAALPVHDAGALVQFTGLVRPTDGTRALVLHHHPTMTLASVEALASEARARFALTALGIVHRVGRMTPGEPVVWVGAAARHRRAAFEAVDRLMDGLKGEALFWKQEERMDGTHWIEPTERDRADLARWAMKDRAVAGERA